MLMVKKLFRFGFNRNSMRIDILCLALEVSYINIFKNKNQLGVVKVKQQLLFSPSFFNDLFTIRQNCLKYCLSQWVWVVIISCRQQSHILTIDQQYDGDF